MIKGKVKEQRVYINKPIVDYRALTSLNQSMLKTFDSDPIKFFEEFKMGKRKKDKTSTALTIGSLVDFFLLACGGDEQEFENRFDEKFALFNGTKGTSQVFILADILFNVTESCLNDRNEATCSFEERFNEAVTLIKDMKDGEGNPKYYKGKPADKILEDFNEKGAEYFQVKMDNIGKLVVDLSLVDKSKIVGKKLLNDPFTKDIFFPDDEKEVFTHFPIEWEIEVLGEIVKCKAEIDRLEIDHVKKIIQPDDLKTNYDNESFAYTYIKNSLYLQNAFYHKATEYWAKEGDLKGYTVRPLRFIVGDTSFNNRRPLVYKSTMEDVEMGWGGFTLKSTGTRYRGVYQLMEEIAWCEKNNIWDCSKESYDNKGIMQLNIQYD